MMADDVRVVAFLQAKPGEEEAVRDALINCVGPSRAEAGNLSYGIHLDKDDPRMFVVLEHWANLAVREQHRQTAHFQAMQNTVDDGDLLDQHFFHVLEPVKGGVKL